LVKKVLRGGSWGFNAGGARSYFRLGVNFASYTNDVGFRLLKTLPSDLGDSNFSVQIQNDKLEINLNDNTSWIESTKIDEDEMNKNLTRQTKSKQEIHKIKNSKKKKS
jgi:hypothetical protein